MDFGDKLDEVLRFWFEELTPKQWWVQDSGLDQKIEERFGTLHAAARSGELKPFRNSALKRLSEVIVLDQFSRNIYRNTKEAFSCDPLALELAKEAVSLGMDQKLPPHQRAFIYMPYMHSEDLKTHDEAVELFELLGSEQSLKFEHAHRDIIVRFGRYPHRNEVLGRESTEEELEFLKTPGSSF